MKKIFYFIIVVSLLSCGPRPKQASYKFKEGDLVCSKLDPETKMIVVDLEFERTYFVKYKVQSYFDDYHWEHIKESELIPYKKPTEQ